MNAGFMNLFGGGSKPPVQSIEISDDAPSWTEIDTLLRNTEPAEERSEFDLMTAGRGNSNHKANIRLFDAPDGFEPEVTLYRDTAGWYFKNSQVSESLYD